MVILTHRAVGGEQCLHWKEMTANLRGDCWLNGKLLYTNEDIPLLVNPAASIHLTDAV